MYNGKFLDGASLQEKFDDEHPSERRRINDRGGAESGSFSFASDLASRFRGDRQDADLEDQRRKEICGLICCCCVVLLLVILLPVVLTRGGDDGGSGSASLDGGGGSTVNETDSGAVPTPNMAPTPPPTNFPTGPPFTFYPTTTGGGGTNGGGNGDDDDDDDNANPDLGHTTFVKNLHMYNVIRGASPDGGLALETQGTPQHKAFVWLQDVDQLGTLNRRSLGEEDDEDTRRKLSLHNEQYIQRYTIAVFYYATNEKNTWATFAKNNWLSPTKSECDWEGINCDESFYVNSMIFDDVGVSGTLPREMGNLNHLTRLEIDSQGLPDKLEGGIPSEFANMTDLSVINILGQNLFEPLPDHLFENWADINEINLSNNKFVGPIPKSIGSLVTCTIFMLNGNQLNEGIPNEIKEMRNLQVLSLSNNKLSGEIPEAALNDLQKIRSIFLDHNHFSGNVPMIDAAFFLENFDVSGNGLLTGDMDPTCPTINANGGGAVVDCIKVTCTLCCPTCN